MLSLVIPVYKNEESLPSLLTELKALADNIVAGFEAIFVVDGSPDNSYLLLTKLLPTAGFSSQLLLLSRNFGSFPAIRAGFQAAKGEYIACMAADLQEPPSLIIDFYQELSGGDCDIVIGERVAREDPLATRLFAGTFWSFYRRFVHRELPRGGVDIFGCTKQVRDCLLQLRESNSSLIGLLFWVGFRRRYVPYSRRAREHGKSAWTFRRKLSYLLDSVISFTDLPIQLLLYTGIGGLLISIIISVVVLTARLFGLIDVPGYTPIVLALTFFGGLNCFGLGIIGGYVWRSYENTKDRPLYVVQSHSNFPGIGVR